MHMNRFLRLAAIDHTLALLQPDLSAEMSQQASTLLLLLEIIQVITTDLQQQWRKLFSWLLQSARAMNSGDLRNISPVDTESILGSFKLMRSGKLDASIFSSLVRRLWWLESTFVSLLHGKKCAVCGNMLTAAALDVWQPEQEQTPSEPFLSSPSEIA